QDNINDAGDIYFMKETSTLTPARVSETSHENNFSFYPNPLSLGDPVIRIIYGTENSQPLHIIDMLGRKVFGSQLPSEGSTSLSLTQLVPGIYQLQIGDESRKLVITR
ncbi:MAG: T9SS type A sorting domain-containing protein, partial [Ignavibacteriota bacterium]